MIDEQLLGRAKELYLSTDLSYAGVAEKTGVPLWIIRKRGAREGWRAQRESGGKTAPAADEALSAAEETAPAADETPEKLLALITSADKLAARVNELSCGAESVKEVKELVSCLKDLTGVIRNLNGLPTFAEAEQMQNAREKLRMENEKDKTEPFKVIIEGDYDGD